MVKYLQVSAYPDLNGSLGRFGLSNNFPILCMMDLLHRNRPPSGRRPEAPSATSPTSIWSAARRAMFLGHSVCATLQQDDARLTLRILSQELHLRRLPRTTSVNENCAAIPLRRARGLHREDALHNFAAGTWSWGSDGAGIGGDLIAPAASKPAPAPAATSNDHRARARPRIFADRPMPSQPAQLTATSRAPSPRP